MRIAAILIPCVVLLGCASARPASTPRAALQAAEVYYWPPGPVLAHPTVRNGAVVEYPQAAPALLEAEAAFQAQRWDDAKAAYDRALEQCPTCYAALTGWGDVEISRRDKAGDIPAALARYERALELNPDDPQLHAFRGSALLRIGRGREGLQELTEALVLRPRYPLPLAILERVKAGGLPVQLDAVPLSPTGWLVPTGESTAGKTQMDFVYAGRGANTLDDMPWIVYGTCKWLGPNGEYKAEQATRRPWDARVEAGCLAKVAEGYKGQTASLAKLEKERGVHLLQHGKALARLVRANDAGYLGEFITYEIRSRMEPQVTLLLGPAERERLRAYVVTFVLGLPGGAAPAAPAPTP
jgi:tetratricopeptide (TPR) repeat protein